jgi:hypothetical protein
MVERSTRVSPLIGSIRRFWRLAVLAGVLLALCPTMGHAQTGAPLDVSAAFPQAFDNNGNPLNGGTLSFFAAGTSTPQTVYSDAALTTPLANPYTLDSAGRAPAIFLAASSYKIVLKDSGGATIATVDNFAGATYLAQQAVVPVVQTTTSTGTVNDFALTSTTAPLVILRCNNASDLILTGFVAGVAGQRVIVQAVGAGNVLLTNQAGSTAANRLINFATSANTPLAAGAGVAEYVRDGTTARWRLETHDQGAPITPTFAAGTYTANGAMSWTVGSGDVTTQTYLLRGRMLTVSTLLQSTTVGGVVSTALIVSNAAWGGFSAAKSASIPGIVNDNAAAFAAAHETVGSALGADTTHIYCFKLPTGNYTLATDATIVEFVFTFEVS